MIKFSFPWCGKASKQEIANFNEFFLPKGTYKITTKKGFYVEGGAHTFSFLEGVYVITLGRELRFRSVGSIVIEKREDNDQWNTINLK